jgi:hypothetical protein
MECAYDNRPPPADMMGLDGVDLVDGIDGIDLRTLLTRLTALAFEINNVHDVKRRRQ